MNGFPDFKSSIIDHRKYGELEKRFFASNKALAAAEDRIRTLEAALLKIVGLSMRTSIDMAWRLDEIYVVARDAHDEDSALETKGEQG